MHAANFVSLAIRVLSLRFPVCRIMFPSFANPLAFWALLGVPVVVAIHFLQHKAREVRTSTLFLIESLAPESRTGRSWERLRVSRAFWLQILAVLLATWVLAGPRWVREESSQTVVMVMDDAAGMSAFRNEAVMAARARMGEAAGRARHTDWVIMTSDPRRPPLYRGADRARAEAALAAEWRPRRGSHDYGAALRLGQALAGSDGVCWFVTDSRAKVPPGQAAVGVGRALENVGFAGASEESREREGVREEGGRWRVLVKNHAATEQRRRWWMESEAGAKGPAQEIVLPPGGLVEIGAGLPEGVARAVLALEGDAFTLDDRLPLVRPRAKVLPVSVELEGEAGEFFRRVAESVPGVRIVPTATGGGDAAGVRGSEGARLRIGRGMLAEDANGRGNLAAIVLAPRAGVGGGDVRVQRAPVVAERHPLVDGLNWQGLIGPGAWRLERSAGDEVLLWQADKPLAWLGTSGGAAGRGDARGWRLVFNFDWEAGNASRLPASVLMLRRFVEAVRDAQPGGYAANFDTGARVPVAEASVAETSPGGEVRLVTGALAGGNSEEGARGRGSEGGHGLSAGELAVLRAPGEPGFFRVVADRAAAGGGEASGFDGVLVEGAAQFSDVRQGDFSQAETFDTGLPAESAAALERAMRPDPLANVWLAVMGGALLWSWWPGGGRRRSQT